MNTTEAYDLYADINAPYVKQTSRVYIVRTPVPAHVDRNDRYYLYCEVEIDGNLLYIQDHSYFLGMQFSKMKHDERMEVYQFLIEWELAEWRRIGPEDSELFATKKLIEQGERYMT